MKKCLLKIKHRKLLEQIEEIEISEEALKNYTLCVWNNRFEDINVLKKKLKRNFILASKMNDRTKKYGNLYIYHDGSVITKIYNQRGRSDGLKIDRKLKKELDYILGL